MTRRRSRLFSVLLAIGLAFGMSVAAAPAQAGVDDFAFESLDVQYYLDRDDAGHSTLRTVETFVAVFPDADQNKGLVRNIPSTYGGTDPFDPRRVDTRLHIVSVTDENGEPVYWETYDAGSGIYGMYIDDDTYKHGRTTYVIEYTQQDVTRHFEDSDADEFYWDINGTGWPQSFGSISATVHLADGLADALDGNATCYRGEYGSDATCPIDVAGDEVSVDETEVGSYQNVSLAIGFASGTFTPGQTVEQHPIVRILPWVLLGVLAAIVVAIVILRRTRWAHARGTGIVVPQYEAPANLGVMPAAAFLGYPKRGFPAQLVEFAVQGIARLIENPEAALRKRYQLELLDRDKAVAKDDDIAMRKLFGMDSGGGTTLVLDKENRKLGDRIASLVSQNAGIPKQRGLVAKGTSVITKFLRWPAFACFVGGWFIVFWAGGNGVGSGLLTLQLIAIIIGSLVVIGFGGVPMRRTQLGAEVLEHLQGLRDYLALAEADRLRVLQSPEGAQRTRIDPSDDDAVIKLYEKLLPWAMVWGVEKQWQGVLGQKYAETQTEPSNIQFTSGFAGLSGFATSAAASGFSQTVTSSSYSSSGGGSSFSSGSSGGGFSGGGGGGGGGGGR
jgi:uncharacterized membrane protein YgcG